MEKRQVIRKWEMGEGNERQKTRSWLITVFYDQISLLSFSLTHSAFYSLCHAVSLSPKKRPSLMERYCFPELNFYTVMVLFSSQKSRAQQFNLRKRFQMLLVQISYIQTHTQRSVYLCTVQCVNMIWLTFTILPSMGHKSIAVTESGG